MIVTVNSPWWFTSTSATMIPLFDYWNWIYAFLFGSTFNRKLNSELVCLVPLGSQYAILDSCICPRCLTRVCNQELCKILQFRSHVNIDRLISVILCVAYVTDSPVPIVCPLISRPVSYPDRPDTNTEYRLLDMQYGDAWLALKLVIERWVPWTGKYGSFDTIRHSSVNYIGLDIDGIAVWVSSLWWYCIPTSWHFAVHSLIPIQETMWQLT